MSAYLQKETSAPPKPITAAGRYEALATDRLPYLERAREASRLTIPALLPPEGHSGHSPLYRPYQSTGADGVNNLAAKLLMALFPTGSPFFRLTMDDFVVEELAAKAQEGSDPRAEFEAVLGKIERAVVNRMEQKGSRKVNFEALLHLIVAGNGLVHVNKEGGEKFFPLDRYVISRDLDDNVLDIVVKETVAKEALEEKVREIVDRRDTASDGSKPDDKSVDVYTWIKRAPSGRWSLSQEVCGEVVSRGTYPKDKSA